MEDDAGGDQPQREETGTSQQSFAIYRDDQSASAMIHEAEDRDKMCLLIGAIGVGKTLLSKRLQNFSLARNSITSTDLVPTVPTVGTNMVNVNMGRRADMVVRELGGSMAPIWNKYYAEAKKIVFVLDVCNRCQVSASCIQLLLMLRDERTSDAAVLIILNKVDMPNAMSRLELGAIMRFDDIVRCASQKVSIAETSAKNGTGVADVIKWLQAT